jgi:hypothetical protein
MQSKEQTLLHAGSRLIPTDRPKRRESTGP